MKPRTSVLIQSATVIVAASLIGVAISRSEQHGLLLNLVFAGVGAMLASIILAITYMVGRALRFVGWKPVCPKRSMRIFFSAFSVAVFGVLIAFLVPSAGAFAFGLVFVCVLVGAGAIFVHSHA